MKTKKLLIAALLLATACGVAYCSTESANNVESGVKLTGVKVDHSESIDFSHFKWLKQYPQLANIESNNQTAVIDKLRTSESISQLIGPINNPYGVRDDILEQIVKMVPESNPKLLQSAIKTAYYYNLGYYSTSDSDKLKFIRKGNTAMDCMYNFYGNLKNANNLFGKITAPMSDTNSRLNYRNHVDSTAFAYQITTQIDNNSQQMCEDGEY